MRWLAIVLIAFVLLAAWVVGIFAPDLRWIPELATGFVVILVGTLLFARWLRARLKARAIERSLLKQALPAGPESRPEIVALRSEMKRAVAALKRGGAGPGRGRSALYALPWYVIVGPSAVGKTTALARSGLSFISNIEGAPKVRGTGGTRNCDWWFGQEAILIDTAGRFATEDDDRDEWIAFLDTLGRLRPERPLDGLMVAVSAPDILAASDDEREHLAAKLRERLDEVLDRLEIVLPVYLILTKADLVAGFVEFWSDLAKPQRAQVWGASFAVNDPRRADIGRAIEAEFDGLVEALHSRLLQRLPHERSPERRARLLQFPLEFGALRAPLTQFVESLCRPRLEKEARLLRGFYFTSGTQVGRPVDRVLAGMQRAFDLRGAQSALLPAEGETLSYFLTDVFRSIILPDRNLAIRSSAGTQRRSRRELRAGVVALGLMAFVILPALVSYVHNVGLARSAAYAVGLLRSVEPGSIPGTIGDPLEAMLDTLDRLDDEATGFAIPGWFGPRAARELRGPLRDAYVARIDAALRLRLGPRLEEQLSKSAVSPSLPDSINSPEDQTILRRAYDTLRLYATLADPKGHVDPAWTAEYLANAWGQTLPANPVPDDRLRRHAANYLSALEVDANRSLRWPPGATKDLRRHMRVVGLEAAQLPYHWVLRRAYGQDPIVETDMGDAESLKYLQFPYGNVLVEAVYTAKGWLKIRDVLDVPLPRNARVEPWVLDDSTIPEDEVSLRKQLRNQYYDEYSSAWMDVPTLVGTRRSLLDKCMVKRPPKGAPASAVKYELMALKGPKGFYRTLFGYFKDGAVGDARPKELPFGIPMPASEGCGSKLLGVFKRDAATPFVEESAVQKRFEPFLAFVGALKEEKAGDPPLEKYLSELEKLTLVLESVGAAPSGDTDSQIAMTQHAIEALLTSFVEPTRSKLGSLLMAPVQMTKVPVSVLTTNNWQAVHDFWHRQLSIHRPFDQSASSVANFEDFKKFAQPTTGLLWNFVAKFKGVELNGDHYVARSNGDALVHADFVKCLNDAKEISDAFFGPDGGLKVAVWVGWSGSDVTEARMFLGQKPTPLVREKWTPLTWAGESEVTLEWLQGGLPQDVRGHDAFALHDLFRILGGLRPAGSGVYVSQAPPLIVKIRSLGDTDSLRPDFLSRLQCPPAISEVQP